MNAIPKFEPLEDRIVLDGIADVTIAGPEDAFLGDSGLEFTLTFDNIDPTDTGYVPFIDLILPTNGTDGDDGVTLVSSEFLGTTLVPEEIVFDASGQAIHPLAVDASGDPIIVTGTPGDTLVVFALPYGSFSAGNPAVDVDIVLDLSDQEDLGAPLNLVARGGFAFGNDELDNPDTDPSTFGEFGAPADAGNYVLTPKLFEITKSNDAPEEEASTGPSYVYTHTIQVEVADGQTLTDFDLTDTLPPQMVYLGNLSAPGATTGDIIEPAINVQASSTDNTLFIPYTSITGVTTVTFDYYIADVPAESTDPIIDPNNGDPATIVNTVTGTGDWTPLDSDDGPVTDLTQTAIDEFQATSLAIQKSGVIINDDGIAGVTPNDVYEFTLDIQISDYFTYGDLVVTDTLGNGFGFVPGSAVLVSTTEDNGESVTTPISLTAFETTTSGSMSTAGQTTNVWRVSDALDDNLAGSGILSGDLVDGVMSGTNTTVQIRYQATVLDQYADDGVVVDVELSQGDLLRNDSRIDANVLNNDDFTEVVGEESNSSFTEVQLPFGAIREKTIFAINGSPPSSDVVIAAGDEITWRIVYDAPLGSFENLRIADNLPQNVFDATEVDTFITPAPGDEGVPPPVGSAQYGPNDQFGALSMSDPTITTDAGNNGVNFVFNNLSVDPRSAVAIEILFTVRVEDAIFADGLQLTNQATAFESNTFGGEVETTAIAQFNYAEPVLSITKGVIATDSTDPAAAFSDLIGPSTATAPGSGGFRFDNPIISDDGIDGSTGDLLGAPVDSNLENIDAGDLVTFAIVVENTGRAPNGAFNIMIEDTLPDGFEIPASGAGLNLSVTDGTGVAIGFTGTLFGTDGIELTDRGIEGALSSYDPTDGDNILIITYDLVASADVTANEVIENVATLTNFTAFEGTVDEPALDRTPVDLTDTATASVPNVEISKSLESREFGEGAGNEVLVGEEFVFTVRVDLPEGTYENAIITDTVRSGAAFGDFEMLSAEISNWNGSLASSNGVMMNTAGVVAGDGDSVSFNLGDLVVAGDNNLTNDFFEFEVTARSVASDTDVGSGDRLENQARFTADGVNVATNNGVNLTEPELTIGKDALPAIVRAGETVNYSIDVENVDGAFDAPAYDLVLTDVLDPNVTLDVGTVQVLVVPADAMDPTVDVSATAVVTGNTAGDTTIEINLDELPEGASLAITYTATVLPDVEAGIEIDNTADLTFDSLPTDDAADERNYDLDAEAIVTTAAPGISKEVISTSNDDTEGSNLAIGEFVTYEIVIDVPEGEVNGASIVDVLPTAPGTLTYVSSEVVRVSFASGPSDIAGSALSAGNMGINSGATTTFTFGDLVNDNNLMLNAGDQIVVRVTAQLTDLADNQSGEMLMNTATFATDRVSVNDTAEVTVVEPVLDIDKTVTPDMADAGDVVTYTILSENTGTGPAYDIIIDDPLSNIGLEGTGTPTIQINGGVAPTGADAPTVAFDGTTGALQAIVPVLLPGQTIEITFQVEITDAAPFSSDLPNTASVTRFDSDPAGDGTDADDGRVYDAGLDGYTVPTDDANIETPDVSLVKDYFGSSDDGTSDADQEVGIGEDITYRLTITVPEGSGDLVLTDVLPTGLEAISANVVSLGAGTTTDNLAAGDASVLDGGPIDADITIAADGSSVEFNFGTAVIEGNPTTGTQTIVVEVVSRVQDIAGNVDTTTLQNTATLAITDPITGVTIQDDVIATETVTVVEPVLDIDKTVTPDMADAGDVVTYTILSENTGTGPAYDIIIDDPLSNIGLEGTGTPTIQINGGVAPTGADAPTVAFDGATGALQAIVPVLLPGQTIEITFQVEITDAAPFSSDLPNTASVTRFDSDPAGDGTDADDGRVYDAGLDGYTVPTDDANIETPDVSLVKDYFGSSDDGTSDADQEVGIGEDITYRLTITVPEGSGDLVLTDVLPTGLEAISANVVSLGAGTTTDNLAAGDASVLDGGPIDADITIAADGSSVEFNFGTAVIEGNPTTGTQTIVVEVVSRVQDIAGNVDTTTLQNTATLAITDPITGVTIQDDVIATETVTVVTPVLDIDKTVTPDMADAGDVVTYTILSENTGTGPAYDIIIDDPLSNIGLEGTGTPTIQINGGVAPTGADAPTVAFDGTTGALQAIVPVLLPGQTIEITFQVEITDAAPFSSDLPNTASVTRFDSDPAGDGTDADDGRVYDAGLDGYTVPTDDAIVTTPDVSLAKDYFGSSDDGTSDADQEVGIGEDITYRLTITVPEGSGDLVLTDVLPTGLEAISANVVSLGDGVTNVTTDNLAAGITDADGNITIAADGSSVVFNFGTAVIEGNPTTGTQTIVVEVVSRVQDIAGNVDTTTLQNTATLAITDPITGVTIQDDVIATETVTVVEPNLTIEKTGPIAANPGDELPYQFTIVNDGTGPAYDIFIQDLMTDPQLSLLGTPTFTVDPGGTVLMPTVTNTAAGGFEVTIPQLLPNETLTVDFVVKLADAAEDARSFPNLATIDYDTVPGNDPADPPGRDYDDEDDHSVATVPFLFKDATDTSFAETGSDRFDPDNVDLIIGEEVTYTLQIYLPEILMDNVVLVDTLDAGLEFVSARFVSADADMLDGVTNTSLAASDVTIANVGQQTTFSFDAVNNLSNGSIGDDDVIVVELIARVVSIDPTTPEDGDELSNTATLNVSATNPSGPFDFTEAVASETIDVVEPELIFEKTGPVAVNLGDTVPYTITIENAGDSPAFDVTISDDVAAANLDFVEGSVSVELANGTAVPFTLDESGTGFSIDIASIGPDTTVIVTYDAVMTSDPAEAATSSTNTANIAYDNFPGVAPDPATERPQTDTDDHIVAANGALEKTIASTSNPDTVDGEHDAAIPDLNIGEVVVFDLVLTLPEINMDFVRLTDQLPAGLTYVSFETVFGTDLTSDTPVFTQAGQLLTFDFANVVNPSDGSVGADDLITVQVTAIVADIPSNVDGVQLTNNSSLTITPVTGETPLNTLTDSVNVEIVEPDLSITKAVSDPEPTAGDTITYTVVVTNSPTATSASYNAIINDDLPFDITSTGNVVLSDPALGTVTTGLTEGDTAIIVEISRLAPGETLTVTYDVFVGYAAVVLDDVVNTAVVTGSSDPDNPGRQETEQDQAVIEVEPIPTDEVKRDRPAGLGIDDAKFLPVLSIDPIYSGTAEPGSNVTVSLYRDTGALSYTRHIMADSGGHWIAIFPRVEYEQVSEDFWDFYDGSNVFDAPIEMIDDVDLTGLAFANDTRSLVVGADILEEAYDLKLSTDRSSILPQDHAMHNARTFYANAIHQMPFLRADVLKVDEVFENIAADNVARMYEASTNPLGDGLNRFNYEFLSDATATPGSAR